MRLILYLVQILCASLPWVVLERQPRVWLLTGFSSHMVLKQQKRCPRRSPLPCTDPRGAQMGALVLQEIWGNILTALLSPPSHISPPHLL